MLLEKGKDCVELKMGVAHVGGLKSDALKGRDLDVIGKRVWETVQFWGACCNER